MSRAELVLDVDTKTQRVILKKKVQLLGSNDPVMKKEWTVEIVIILQV